MKTIQEFRVQVADMVTIDMPRLAKVLCIKCLAPRVITFWAQIDSDERTEERTFFIVGMGTMLPDAARRYVGTVFDGIFIWHVYDRYCSEP